MGVALGKGRSSQQWSLALRDRIALLGGCGALAFVLRWLWQKLVQRRKALALQIDPRAAFPSAHPMAYLRGIDARSPTPLIGGNIGGRPDSYGEFFAGSLGKEFAADYGSERYSVQCLVARTRFYDALWMEAASKGCTQFVILAAGLDSRAWRMPALDKSIKVFEVDVATCFAYKSEKIANLPSWLPSSTPCTRVVVAADLSEPSWPAQLVSAGFDPSQLSFFLAEGLLMYMVPATVRSFLPAVSSLMCKGSTFTGCCFINCLHFMNPTFASTLAKYGTGWTFEAASERDLRELLSHASLEVQDIKDTSAVMNVLPSTEDESVAAGNPNSEIVTEETKQQGAKIMRTIESLGIWPQALIDWLRHTTPQRGGCEEIAKALVADPLNCHGLKHLPQAQKERVVRFLMGAGFSDRVRANLHAFRSDGGISDSMTGYTYFVTTIA